MLRFTPLYLTKVHFKFRRSDMKILYFLTEVHTVYIAKLPISLVRKSDCIVDLHFQLQPSHTLNMCRVLSMNKSYTMCPHPMTVKYQLPSRRLFREQNFVKQQTGPPVMGGFYSHFFGYFPFDFLHYFLHFQFAVK
jgi:hypothetical protein